MTDRAGPAAVATASPSADAGLRADVRHWVLSYLSGEHHVSFDDIAESDKLRSWVGDGADLRLLSLHFNIAKKLHLRLRNAVVTPSKIAKATKNGTIADLIDVLTRAANDPDQKLLSRLPDAAMARAATSPGAVIPDLKTQVGNWVKQRLKGLCNGGYPTCNANIKSDLDCGSNALNKLADAIPLYVQGWGADPEKFDLGATNLTKLYGKKTVGELIDFLVGRVRAAS